MAERKITYKIAPFIEGGKVVDASNVEVDTTGLPLLNDTSQESFRSLQNQINTLVVPPPQAFRPFRTFTGGTLISNNLFRIERITLDSANLSEWNDTNNIYAAGRVDKNVEILLPTDAEIAASSETYPIQIEITHLGGSQRFTDRNFVIPQVKAADTARIDTVAQGTQTMTTIQQNDVVILTKNASGQNWQEARAIHVSSDALLPSGVFDLQERRILNITNLTLELSTVGLVRAGDAYEITNGGTYFGEEIRSGDVIVALQDNPDTTTTSDDWLVISNGSGVLSQDEIAFFNQVSRTGNRFDLSRTVFVNPSNVSEVNTMARNTPVTLTYTDAYSDGATGRTRVFANQPFQFPDLQGGTLTLAINFSASSFSGFLPELTDISFDYGSGNVFTFPLTNVDSSSANLLINITIPNQDYTAILDSNCTVTLNYQFRGNSFDGSFTIQGLMNSLDGTLLNGVTSIADNRAALVEHRLQTQIDQLKNGANDEDANFAAIQDRISPYRSDVVNSPVQGALFDNTTAVTPFPTDLGTLNTVSPSNPRFTTNSTVVFVAVPVEGRAGFILRNVTQDTLTTLADSDPNVSLGESLSYNGQTYFVYRVSGITSGDVIEVVTISTVQRVAWQEDIDQLKNDVQELENERDDIPDEVRNVLENEVSVTEETSVSLTPSNFNTSLGLNGTQKVFSEATPNTPSGGSLNSNAFSVTGGTSRARQKLVYIGQDHVYGNADLLTAFDGGSTTTTLADYSNGDIRAKVFVPAIPSGSTNVTVYPAPAARVSGAGIWQTIETLTFQNGIPVPEADELFFTRNMPSQPTTLTIQYRGHANGNIFGTGTATLPNTGGNNEIATTFTISDGSETAAVEVRYYPNLNGQGRAIRVSVTERVNAGLPTINDVQVILSYSETRVVPATPATTRDVVIESQATTGQSNVIAVKPSSSGTVILVGNTREVDTGYPYTTIFGATEGGHLTVLSNEGAFYDYQDVNIINPVIQNLESYSDRPNFGLFDTNYTHETIVVLDTQLQVKNSQNDTVNVGQELVLVAPNGNRWRLSVDNTGTLITTQIT